MDSLHETRKFKQKQLMGYNFKCHKRWLIYLNLFCFFCLFFGCCCCCCLLALAGYVVLSVAWLMVQKSSYVTNNINLPLDMSTSLFFILFHFFVVKTNNDLHIWCCMVQWIIQIHNSNEVNAPPGSSFSFLCCFSCLPTVFRCCNVPSKVKCWWFPSFQLGLCVTQGVALHSYVHSLFIEHLLPLIFV